MEEFADDRRQYTRFPNPQMEDGRGVVQISAPDLAGGSVGPEDFSSGGFRMVVFIEPRMGQIVTCSLRLGDITVDGIRMRVVRIKENFGRPPTWEVGLLLDMEEEVRDQIASLLTVILAKN